MEICIVILLIVFIIVRPSSEFQSSTPSVLALIPLIR